MPGNVPIVKTRPGEGNGEEAVSRGGWLTEKICYDRGTVWSVCCTWWQELCDDGIARQCETDETTEAGVERFICDFCRSRYGRVEISSVKA